MATVSEGWLVALLPSGGGEVTHGRSGHGPDEQSGGVQMTREAHGAPTRQHQSCADGSAWNEVD